MSSLQDIEVVIKSLQSLISDREISSKPPQELLNMEGFAMIYNSLLELRKAFISIGTGELTYPVMGKGYLPAALKSLQASLQHLTWQTKAIAAGDLTQSVDFLGEFSEAFNHMTKQLELTLHESTRAECVAREAKEHFELVFNTSPDPIIITRLADGLIVNVNQAFLASTGYTKAEVIGETALQLHLYENPVDCHKIRNEISTQGDCKNIEIDFRIKDGRKITGIISANRITLNEISHMIIVMHDITERKFTEMKLQQSEEKYRILFDNAIETIVVVQDAIVKFYNPMLLELSGYSKAELSAVPFIELIYQEDREFVYNRYSRRIKGEVVPTRYHYRLVRKDHNIRWVEINSIIIEWEGKEATLNFLTDITERKKTEEKILYLSYHDQLTGLYNRRFYEEKLKRLDRKSNLPITLVMADVNGLKLTNDAFGHLAGDKLIQKIGEILKKECGADDIVARIGGDEFVLLLPKTNTETTEKIIQRINRSMATQQNGHTILSVSFGYATKNVVHEEITKVYTQAEDHMYRQKLSESTRMKSATIKLITKTLYEKNAIEKKHCKKVSELCKKIGLALGLSLDEINELGMLGLLHDIGKIGIDEHVLNKPGELTESEWLEMKRHPEIGYQILKSVNKFSQIAEFVLAHHERIDGQGYPKGLQGQAIPLQSKILLIAEAYDAIISDRFYKDTLSQEVAIQELKNNAGIQFDAHITKVFVERVLGKPWN